MTPGARVQAAIDALTEIRSGPSPADAVLNSYFKSRRYIGSKDRAAVAELVYGSLRAHARIGWWIERAGQEATPRRRIMAFVVLGERKPVEFLDRLCDGGTYRPEPLTSEERTMLRGLEGHTLDHPDMPDRVRVECPEWAEEALMALFGSRFVPELDALNQGAPLDLRANALLAHRNKAQAALQKEGIRAEPTALSPLGLRVGGRPPLSATETFRKGMIEVQDEGSQILAALVQAQPGMQVVDFCAGAGGKTLAIAAQMDNRGRIIACDVHDKRLEQAAKRLRRASVHNVERRVLSSERDPWVKRHKGMFDRVLVDAPCSGTGTWRRNPDAKWGRGGPDLDELVKLQREILDSASRLVKPGGRLVYGTCSLLPIEDEDQVQAFLERHPEFRLVPVAELWPQISEAPVPTDKPWLRLTPARHGTDGFFAAVMQRAD